MPTIRGVEAPSVCRTAPAKRPWFDSTRPMPASSGQEMPQAGVRVASRTVAFWYAASAVLGIPLAARPEIWAAPGLGAADVVGGTTAGRVVDPPVAARMAEVAASCAKAAAPAGSRTALTGAGRASRSG